MTEVRSRWLLTALVLSVMALPGAALGYEPERHQRLTFFAAKALNRCLDDTGVAHLTPLQVRFIANSNMGLADSNALVRFFRWSYFDPARDDDRSFLWLINTRFIDHFEELTGNVRQAADAAERYEELGRIVSYVQLVSSPPRALPVYTGRFWRWSFRDRFDDYRVDPAALERAVEAAACDFLAPPPESFQRILADVAADTLRAVRSPIGGLPTTWEAFWVPDEDPGEFGEYGPAGNNFGRRVEFPCRSGDAARCVLLKDDPLYEEFALARQLAAVRGTARAMYLHQLEFAQAPAASAD
ncbi:MAG: hypothetical protein U5Q16_14170 [Gammaproteobacteria bacterium]|nr:hypothetical protein [Gammaproteobacteria bacterium]